MYSAGAMIGDWFRHPIGRRAVAQMYSARAATSWQQRTYLTPSDSQIPSNLKHVGDPAQREGQCSRDGTGRVGNGTDETDETDRSMRRYTGVGLSHPPIGPIRLIRPIADPSGPIKSQPTSPVRSADGSVRSTSPVSWT
jgi:hypothetical protein